jgi:four helix bundle protein
LRKEHQEKSLLERKRFYEIARGSIVEIDAAIDIANDLGYIRNCEIDKLEEKMVRCFKMISGLIR